MGRLFKTTEPYEFCRADDQHSLRQRVDDYILFELFSITLSFVVLLDSGSGYLYDFLAAFLCMGLTMLLVILVKMSTLTHKKAKQTWDPYQKLLYVADSTG